MDRGPNWFAGSGVPRLEQRRRDAGWITDCLRNPRTRIAPVWRNRNLLDGDVAALPMLGQLSALTDHVQVFVLLGEIDGEAVFAADFDPAEGGIAGQLADFGQLGDLREMAGRLDRTEAAWLAHARAMAFWHKTHQFCGSCGGRTVVSDAGHARVCEQPACARQHFPRTDPAVIVLVEHEDRCLLGRNTNWTDGLYSTLAGFVEPGESLEDTVRREIEEESGVIVGDVRYHSSQPWPFPASIMLGFFAEAVDPAITIDERELADARWFNREELVAETLAGNLRLPRGVSIARRLVDDWYALCGHSLSDALAR
ncbi:MAG: NAD(+) diphosphatase [Pseudomonadota bacterium]